jgi:hypothetical protein
VLARDTMIVDRSLAAQLLEGDRDVRRSEVDGPCGDNSHRKVQSVPGDSSAGPTRHALSGDVDDRTATEVIHAFDTYSLRR